MTIYSTIVDDGAGFLRRALRREAADGRHRPADAPSGFQEVEPFGIGALSMSNVIVPTFLMMGPIVVDVVHSQEVEADHPRGDGGAVHGLRRGYVVLTIVGTFFRGQGMHLCWLTDPCQIRID